MKPMRIGFKIVATLLLCGQSAMAGPDYQNLKACLRDCIATTPRFTLARLACVLDCYADYVDSKIAMNDGPNLGVTVASTGYTANGGNPFLNLIGVGTATVSLNILAGPGPLQIDYILVSDQFNPPNPGFGTLLGSSTNASNKFAFNFSPTQDGIIVAQAHYTSSPTEDIDQATAIYFSTSALVPEPSSGLLAGVGMSGVAACVRFRRWRSRRPDRLCLIGHRRGPDMPGLHESDLGMNPAGG